MQSRRKFALLFSTVGCAFALLFPAPLPGLGMIETGAPPPVDALAFDAAASAAMLADHDLAMATLRQQANAALAQLQAVSARQP